MQSTYWFKRKRYGYGYYPATWQGVLSILIFLICLFASVIFLLTDTKYISNDQLIVFLILTAIEVSLLIIVTI
jgi:hypothetical protein